ncbi:hypothetical protein HDU91_002219, partial [Kappamyces sp. JEL0680]
GGLDSWHATLDDPAAAAYIAGTAVHWYNDEDYILNLPLSSTDQLDKHHERYPNKFILASEACEGYLPPGLGTGAGTKLDSPNTQWDRATNYARDIIDDLNHWVVGWTDWSTCLASHR